MPDFSAVDEFLGSAVAAGHFPGAVYLVGRGRAALVCRAFGSAVVTPEAIPASPETIYDLASLTKPLVTALLCILLRQDELLDLDARASHYLPELAANDKRAVTVKQLLTHSAGLPAWRPLYAELEDPGQVVRYIAGVPLEYEPGTKVIYSDLGFILLGKLVERLSARPLAEVAGARIFLPLALAHTCFNPPQSLRPKIAATEEGNRYEKELAGAAASHFRGWRSRLIWGEVHDGNAHFLGGAAGHAGLFATAEDVFRLAQQFLPGGELVRAENLPHFSTNFTQGLGIDRSIGWTLATNRQGAAGARLGERAFGHSGFTGTSLWLEPDRQHTFILLTNRVHPRRSDCDMDELRRGFHDRAAVALAAGELTG